MGLLITVFTWICARFAKLVQVAISLPVLLTAIVGVFVQGCLIVYDKIDEASHALQTFVSGYVVSSSEFEAIVGNAWFGVISYSLALDKFIEGVVLLVGAIAFLEMIFVLLIVEYFLPCVLAILVNKIGLRIQKAILPSGWSSDIHIDCPDLMQLEFQDGG